MFRIEEKYEEISTTFPENIALSTAKESVHFKGLREKSRKLAVLIKGKCGRCGDPVGIMLPNSVSFIQAAFAVWYSRNVVVPINVNCWPDEIERLIKKLGISLLITDVGGAKKLKGKLPSTIISVHEGRDWDIYVHDTQNRVAELAFSENDAVVFLTSGTTGQSKIVCISHENIFHNLASERDYIPLTPDEKTFLCMPMSHSYAFKRQMLGVLLAGGQVHIGSESKLGTKIAEEICSSECTSIFAVPPMFRIIVDGLMRTNNSKNVDRIKYLVSCSCPMTQEILTKMRETFEKSDIFLTYGLSEASPVTYLPPNLIKKKKCSIGKAVKGTEIKLKTTGRMNGTDVGEIMIRGKGVVKEYLNNPEANNEAFVDGFFKTGDVARSDPDGYLFLVGRIKDIINRAGENIYPEEIEAVLQKYERVQEVAVVACPHPVLGEVPFVFVTPKGSSEEFDLSFFRTICFRYLPPQKRPIGIEILETMPRTDTGKICKRNLVGILSERYSYNLPSR